MCIGFYSLETAIIVPIPRSGMYVCKAHKAEKSPIVHPTRQRKVLMPALFQVFRQVQNARLDIVEVGFVEAALLYSLPSLLVARI